LPNRPERARFAPPRLYAILDTDSAAAGGPAPVELAGAWIDAGVRLIQIRAKSFTLGPFTSLARAVAALARPADCVVIVNDRADVAALAHAAGVHVGQDDLRPREIRDRVGPSLRGDVSITPLDLIGLSTHTASQADAAAREPIDYVAIGPVFATSTKSSAWPAVGLDGVRAAVEVSAGRPVVAIGGITLATAPAVIAAGAASVAVISDLLIGAPGDRAREYLRALA
jgi:thiamine-phosphate pyrophosphorylase